MVADRDGGSAPRGDGSQGLVTARAPRMDAPGRFHRRFDHAAGRQVSLADRPDDRKLLMLLACAVRHGEFRTQAYCLLGTHFPLARHLDRVGSPLS